MRRYLAIAIVFVLLLLAVFMAFTVAKTTILVDQASASHSARTTFVWSYVGGDPLIPGGVWTKAKFISLMKHSAKVRAALKLVVRANGDPEWVLPAAYKNLRNSKSGTIAKGTLVRTMSYGSLKISLDTVYNGQYKRLPIFYVVASKTTTVEINGKPYRQTVSYWVSMAKKCGNVFIFHKTTKNKPVPQPKPKSSIYVVKRQDSIIGLMLDNWNIEGLVGDRPVRVVTNSTLPTLVGTYPIGTSYNLSEINQANWTVVSPANGNFTGVTTKDDIVLTYVNRYIPPAPSLYRLTVEKRMDSTIGQLLSGWIIEGTVGGSQVSVTTGSSSSTLIGSYPAGTAYNLSEIMKAGWVAVSPINGNYTGVTPANDLILIFVNRYVPVPPVPTPEPTPTPTVCPTPTATPTPPPIPF